MLVIRKCCIVLALLSSCVVSSADQESNKSEQYAESLLHESMSWMDMYYDYDKGYLFSLDAAALTHETRASVWYAAGLLARGKAHDVEQAVRIVENVIGGQFVGVEDQWFGDYQVYPEEPAIGSKEYPAVIYNAWDPNWRGFVGTTFILMLQEFPHLIPRETQRSMLASLVNTTIGDSYRIGGFDNDNLYPAYSNPSIMRAFVSGWAGRRTNDSNMTSAGEAYAKAVIDLFARANTLSEFNSGTYVGVSLWAKYMPKDSLMGQHGEDMIRHTWTSLGELYNANLKNVAGPWDRSYGFDMSRYLSILALHIWTLVGKENAPVHSKPYAMGHKNDFAISPIIAILAPFHNHLVPPDALAALTVFSGPHTVTTSAFSPPYDTYPRNITAVLTANLTIGAASFYETVVGGPAQNPRSFNPAVAQWARQDGSVGWLSLYAQVSALDVVVGEGVLEVSYPMGDDRSAFSFLVGTNSWNGKREVNGWEDIEGLNVDVQGSVDLNYTVAFHGLFGGQGEVVNDFEFWNFTYKMPERSGELPRVQLKFSTV